MRKFFEFIINNRITMSILQIGLAYTGWSITAVTIVNSSLNSIGLFAIILALFLRDIINGSIRLYNYLGFNEE